MTLEKEIEIEMKRADELIDMVSAIRPTKFSYSLHYGHLGEVKRFNAMLKEILDTFAEGYDEN